MLSWEEYTALAFPSPFGASKAASFSNYQAAAMDIEIYMSSSPDEAPLRGRICFKSELYDTEMVGERFWS